MKRNGQGGYQVDEPGGYEREAGEAFGIGTIKPCSQHWFITKGQTSSFAHAFHEDEPDGTQRCVHCGVTLEAQP